MHNLFWRKTKKTQLGTCLSVNWNYKLKYQFLDEADLGGDETRSGYMQYVPVILADVPARTMFIDILILCDAFLAST